MDRLRRLYRLALERGDLAAMVIIEGRVLAWHAASPSNVNIRFVKWTLTK